MIQRIELFTRYTRLGASSRLRCMQYQPILQDRGFDVANFPLFSDEYLFNLYSRKSVIFDVIRGFLSRISALSHFRPGDLFWVQNELFPWIPWFLENRFIPRGAILVTDYDDAIFHRYDLHASPAIRKILGRKIDEVMAASALVLAGNAYLADRASAAGARRVEIVPTVVDMQSYQARPQSPTAGLPSIGWIGTPSTWKEYMEPMMPVLASIAEASGARIKAVGAGRSAKPHPLLDTLPWSEESEVGLIQEMDIGVMPLIDSPWARGKCGYKLVQYMACGLPVVASPVGVNAEIVDHGVNGFLASSDEEWRAAINLLIADPDLRSKMGAEGRRKIQERYSLQVWGARVAAMLSDTAMVRLSGVN